MAKKKKRALAKQDPLLGQVVMDVRPATPEELISMGWNPDTALMVLVMSSGARVFASGDDEYNYGGTLNYAHEGKVYSLYPPRKR